MSEKNWIRCPKCGHKFFFLRAGENVKLEIKCSSCKNVVTVVILNGEVSTEENNGDR